MPISKVLLIGVYLGRRTPSLLKRKPLELFEPWIQRRFVMNSMQAYLSKRGYDVTVSPIGVSTRHIEETVSLHRQFLLGHNGTWDIVGWSTGGVVGYGLKIFEPERVRKLVTLSTPVWGTTEDELNEEVLSLGLSSNLYETWRRQILKRSRGTQVLMTKGDTTAPPERCRILDSNDLTWAKHQLVEEETPSRSLAHHSIGKSERTFALVDEFLRKEDT